MEFPECIASNGLDTGTMYTIDSSIESRLHSIDHQSNRDQSFLVLSDVNTARNASMEFGAIKFYCCGCMRQTKYGLVEALISYCQ